MLYEFGYNNTSTLGFVIDNLKKANLKVDFFYTGTDIVCTGRMTGNSSLHDIAEQNKLIHCDFPEAKLLIVANDTVLNNFNFKHTISRIKELFEVAKINGLIVANPILLHYLSEYLESQKADVIISTITGLDSLEKIQNFIEQDFYFTGMVAPITINRDLKTLTSIKKILGEKTLTIIPNESCLPFCVNRQFHFNAHSIKNSSFSNIFASRCSEEIAQNPAKVLMSGVVSPSMFSDGYSQVVDIIKFPNRHLTEKSSVIKSISQLRYYFNCQDPTNFFDLLTFDYNYFIQSLQLKPLFQVWKNCRNRCYSCTFCDKYKKHINPLLEY